MILSSRKIIKNLPMFILFGIAVFLANTCLILSPVSAQEDITLIKSDYLGMDIIDLEGIPITKEDVVKLALAQSLDIKIADWQNIGKGADLIQAESIYDTNLSLVGDRDMDKRQQPTIVLGNRVVTGRGNVGIKKKIPLGTDIEIKWDNTRRSTNSLFATLPKLYESRTEVAVRQPVLKNFFGYIDRASVRLAKIDVSSFDLGTKDTFEDVVAKAIDEYWNVVFAYEMLISKQKALERAEEFLQITKDQLKRGLTEIEDIHAAEANMRIRLTELLVNRNLYVDAVNNLKFLLDIKSDELLIPEDALSYKPAGLSFDVEIEQAFEYRRDFKQSKLDLKAKGIELKMAKQSKFPEVDLIGSFAANGLDKNMFDAIGEQYPGRHPQYLFGFEFTFPLENREAKAEFLRAKANKAQSVLEFKQLGQKIYWEVDRDFREVTLAEERVEQYQQIETLQREKLEGQQKKFAIGRSSSKDIIDYQNDLIDAEARAIQSLVLHNQALNALARTTNTLLLSLGYDDNKIEEVVKE